VDYLANESRELPLKGFDSRERKVIIAFS